MQCPECGHRFSVIAVTSYGAGRSKRVPPPRAFQAWKLRYCDKMELAEVAERMGIAYQTVLIHLNRFRQWCPEVAPNQSDLKKEKQFSFDENRDSGLKE